MSERISRLQFVVLMIWNILGTGFVTIPFAFAHFDIRDSWIAALLFMAGTTVATLVYYIFLKVFPNAVLSDAIEQGYGRAIGFLMHFFIIVWFVVTTAMLVRELNLFVETTILPKSPLYLINAAMIVAVVYAAYAGIEVMGRTAELVSLIAFAAILAVIVMPVSKADFHQLTPILANGWTPVLRASITPDISFALEFIVGLQFITSLKRPDKAAQDVMIAGGVVTATLLFGTLLVTTVLGPAAAYLAFPGVEVARSIQFGQFVERVDTIIVLTTVGTLFLKISIFFYALCNYTASALRLVSMKHITLPAGMLVWTGSILFWKNASAIQSYMLFVTPAYFFVTLLLIPMGGAALALLRRTAVRPAQNSQK
ncbi:endospore germination permease [Alicyclobacillus sp. SO9]|uniref:GerAB/ArcD/ProY family transporter n=1 Tax=Alicyclobacillus sp. SO9 TaxID=2665646 RepID=UPI0018E862FF|nr:endospore germination permease [Alicyclobacillus sp. SO9]QQE80836.1 endospore germination permease [Alicyclobacillus sp. SO9]